MVRHFLSPVVTKAVAGLVVGCALSMLPARAGAQAPEAVPPPAPASAPAGALGQGFGEAGQIVISNEGFFGFDRVNRVGYDVVLKPSVDYFIMPAISGGLVAAYVKSTKGTGADVTTTGFGLRGGFNFNVTENVGVWGKVGVLYQHDSAGMATFSTTWISAFVPVMYHIVPHLFVGLAPYYNIKIAGDGNHNYGVSWLIGGWF
jgi:hypothetical protein